MMPETSSADTVTLPDKTDDNAVFGRKGVMDYVMAIRMPFNKGATDIKIVANEAWAKQVGMIRASRIELFLWHIHYSVQSLYAPFPFTREYIASPTRRAVFTRFFVKKSFLPIK
ncbi:MAG: hypothetical protein U9N43_01215 [Euryarchaeota archaeon]|nr:hypothetical protein [Euryarchaeota archaeon]